MKYFGEYLVSKNIITEQDLVVTLIEQMRGVPMIAEILLQKQKLSTSQFIAAFGMQHEKKCDFRQACMGLGVWTPELDALVTQEVQAARVPLGHLLIKRGLTDLGTLTKALDEFLSKIESPVATPAAGANIDPMLLEEFTLQLDNEKLDRIRNKFAGLKMLGTDVELHKGVMNALLAELHVVRGLMRCVKIDRFETLMASSEEMCTRILSSLEAGRPVDLTAASSLGQAIVELVVRFRDGMIQEPSEGAWFSHESNRNEFEGISGKIQGAYSGVG